MKETFSLKTSGDNPMLLPSASSERPLRAPEGSEKDAGQRALLRDTHLPLATAPDDASCRGRAASYSVPELCHGPPEQKHQTDTEQQSQGGSQRQ